MATKKALAPSSGEVLADLGTDGAKWSAALAAVLNTMIAGDISADFTFDGSPGSDLFGWVANMIEAGRSAGYAKGQEDLSSAVKLYGEFDDAMKRDELTILFLGKRGVGKSQMAGEIRDMLAPFEIDAVLSNVTWTKDDYDVLVIKLDKEDHKALGKGEFINLAHVADLPEQGMGEAPIGVYRVTPDAWRTWIDHAHEAGRDATRKEGLNTDDDVPVLRLPDVNAIEIDIGPKDERYFGLTVDGRLRAKLGKPNTVIITCDGNRYVLLREGEALETPPNRIDGE